MLGRRFALVIGIGLLIDLLALFGLTSLIINGQFRQIEAESLHANYERFLATMNREKQALFVAVSSYSAWNDAYDYMKQRNQDFIDNNFDNAWLKIQDIDFVLLIDEKGQRVWTNVSSSGEAHAASGFLGSPKFNLADRRVFPDGWEKSPSTFTVSYAVTDGGPLLYCAHVVTDNYFQAKPRGIMIFGRLFDARRLDLVTPGPDIQVSFLKTEAATNVAELAFEPTELAMYQPFGDANIDLPYTVRFAIKRELEAAGDNLQRSILIVATLASLFIVGTVFLFFRKWVVQRVRYYRDHLDEFMVDLSVAAPLKDKYPDELGALADHVNHLVDRVVSQKKQLESIANTDQLTGLANRRLFEDHIDREAKRQSRLVFKENRVQDPSQEAWLSLIIADIDNFKKYNDYFGHVEGDNCLREVAQAIHSAIGRPGDLACRFGGEEFVVVLPSTTEAGALIVAERVRKKVLDRQLPHPLSPTIPWVTISLGLASCHMGQTFDTKELVKRADQALYQSKAAGRNQTKCYTNE